MLLFLSEQEGRSKVYVMEREAVTKEFAGRLKAMTSIVQMQSDEEGEQDLRRHVAQHINVIFFVDGLQG